jgi:hypothetical protein
MNSAPSKARSHWREFAYVFHDIQRAIEPPCGLGQTLEAWDEIQRDLAESYRKRQTQEQKARKTS